jgi:hypothetical protein
MSEAWRNFCNPGTNLNGELARSRYKLTWHHEFYPGRKSWPKALAQYRGTKLNRRQKIYPGAGFDGGQMRVSGCKCFILSLIESRIKSAKIVTNK